MSRARWAAIGAAVAVTLGAGGLGIARAAISEGDKPVYVSLEQPCRLVDTRPANQIGVKGTPIAAGEANAYEVQVTGESGDCAGDDGPAVPVDAVGVALNVTVIAPAAPSGRSYFTVYPADAPLPGTSNLNFVDGQTPFPNKVDVGLSPDGRIRIYNDDGTAHVAVDVFGYYVDHDHDDRYPARSEVYTKGDVDALLDDTYTRAEVDDLLAPLIDRIEELESSRPFAVTEYVAPENNQFSQTPGPFATIGVTAPVDGMVVVSATALVGEGSGNPGADVSCSILPATAIPAGGLQSDFLYFETAADANEGTISGTRAFEIEGGDNVEYVLACQDYFNDGGEITEARLVAVFLPAQVL